MEAEGGLRLSFKLMMQVRNEIVEGYQAILRMQV